MWKNINEKQIFERANHFKKIISEYSSEMCEEISGIAKGSEQPEEYIYAINSRTELTELDEEPPEKKENDVECTTIYLGNQKKLCQNWDWKRDFWFFNSIFFLFFINYLISFFYNYFFKVTLL